MAEDLGSSSGVSFSNEDIKKKRNDDSNTPPAEGFQETGIGGMARLILRNAVYMSRNYGSPILHSALPCKITSPRSYANLLHIAKYCSVKGDLPTIQKPLLISAGETSLTELEEDEILLELEKKFTPEQKEYMLPSKLREEHSKILLEKIMESRSSYEIFSLYRQYSSAMGVKHLLKVMKILDNLIVEGSLNSLELHQNEHFQDICQILLKASRRMETSELLNLLHHSCRMDIDVNSKLVGTVLQLLKHNQNDLELRELIHLEFLLRKFPVTPLSQALSTAIPLLLQNVLIEEPLDHIKHGQLSLTLALGVQARIKHLGRVLSEIHMRGPINSHLLAKFLLSSLLKIFAVDRKPVPLNKTDLLISKILMKECMGVFVKNMHRYTPSEVESVLAKVCAAYSNLGRLCFNDHFLNTIASYFIKSDVEISRVSRIVYKFLKLDFLSEELTDYVMTTILQDKTAIDEYCLIGALITAVSSYTISTAVRQTVIDIFLKQKFFLTLDFESCLKFPSLNMALDLLSIGCYHMPLLKIMTSRKFLDKYTYENPNSFVMNSELLQLNQVLSTFDKVSLRVPEDYLKNSRDFQENRTCCLSDLLISLWQIYEDFDKSYVVSGVLADNDLYIDHLIVLDESNVPVKVLESRNSDKSINIADLNISQDHKRVAVLDVKPFKTYSPKNILKSYVRVHQQLLEASGFIVVPVLQKNVNQHYKNERNLYIRKLIGDAINAEKR